MIGKRSGHFHFNPDHAEYENLPREQNELPKEFLEQLDQAEWCTIPVSHSKFSYLESWNIPEKFSEEFLTLVLNRLDEQLEK